MTREGESSRDPTPNRETTGSRPSLSTPLHIPAPEPDGVVDGVERGRVFEALFHQPAAPTTIGRYEIMGTLGSGGMGTVLEAFDLTLNRKVALKLLHPDIGETQRQRQLREAQALAMLSHPNVVQVFEVGELEGRVFIAMELVRGTTLRAWQGEQARGWKEVLDCYLEAGRGLVAVHEAGLVHRDFKPDNVLLGDDGRLRVADFGLARASTSLDETHLESIPSAHDVMSDRITRPGGIVGTPAYMAPEQLKGGETDARTDQFSFCVALYEALYGQRPFEGRTLMALIVAQSIGLAPPPRRSTVPRRIWRALARGLSIDPDRRFPDMSSVLAALAPRSRWWLALGVAMGAAGTTGAALAAVMVRGDVVPERDPCLDAPSPVDEIWTEKRRSTVESTLPAPYATAVVGQLDRWAERWRRTATTSCEDVHVRSLVSEDALDRRGICLRRKLDGFAVLVDELESGTVDSPRGVVQWFGTMGDPDECLEESVLLTDWTSPPPEHAEELDELGRQLVRVGMTRDGDFAARLELAEDIRDRAVEIGWQPLVGETWLTLGVLHQHLREQKQARVALGRALDIGIATTDIELRAQAWSELNTIAFEERELEAGEWAWQRHAAVFEPLDPSPRQRARLQYFRALNLDCAQSYPEAEAAYRESIDLYRSLGPSGAWDQAAATRALATLLSASERTEAVDLLEQARTLELGEQAARGLGRTKAGTLLDEGITRLGAGDPERARSVLEQGLEHSILERGPRSEMVARMHVALAAVCDLLEDFEALRTHAELADSISLVAVGPRHPLRIDVLSALGRSAEQGGRLDDSADAYERSLELAREHETIGPVAIAFAEINLARVLHARGRDDEAGPLVDQGIATIERELSKDDPNLAEYLRLRAEIALARGEHEQATTDLERATALATSPELRQAIEALLDQARQ